MPCARATGKTSTKTRPQAWSEERQETLESVKPQLYNLANDPAETQNLADQNPELVNQLAGELNRIRNTQ